MISVAFHRECGRHSGIPTCCIYWFIGPWLHFVSKVPRLWKMYYEANGTVEYIRCPMCITIDRQKEMTLCNCDMEMVQ
jgi:hypothetical protein